MSESRPRSLGDALRALGDDDLAALLRDRPDLTVPPPTDLGVLATRLSGRLSVLRALELLDQFQLEVLDGLVLLGGGPVSCAELRELIGPAAEDADVRGAVDRLRALALIWGDDAALHLAGQVRDVAPAYPAGLGRPYGQLVGADAPTQAEVAALLAGCDDEEREVLAHLAAGPPLGAVRGARRVDDGAAPGPVRRLIARGLLVPIDDETVELPREVALTLRGDTPLGTLHPQPPEISASVREPSTSERAGAGQVLEALRLVESLLDACAAEPPPELRSGGMGVRDVRRLARALTVPESTIALLGEIAQAAQLLASGGGIEPLWLPTRSYDAWRARPAAQRWAVLARAWLTMPRLPALAGLRDDRDKVLAPLAAELQRTGAPDARRRTLDALAGLPAGSAPTPDALAALLAWQAPRRGGRLRDDQVRWALAEAELLGVTGRGALPSYARALLAEGDPAPILEPLLPQPLDHVLVQADLTVVAPGPLEPELAEEMALVADVESAGSATVYRIGPESVRRALDAGRSATELHELFRTRSRTPVPQSLSYLIDDVARRHGELRAGPASSYLHSDDEALLAQLVSDRRLADLRLRLLAPTVIVCPRPVGTLHEELRRAGYPSVLESDQGELQIAVIPGRRVARPRPLVRVPATPQPPDEAQLARLVGELRARDRAARAARRNPVTTTTLPGVTTASTLSLLQQAVRDRRRVWLSYVDSAGNATARIVEPRSVGGGYLRADDGREETTHTFALHRIASVALVDSDG